MVVGCDDKGTPLKKSWRLMTTSKDIVEALGVSSVSTNLKNTAKAEAKLWNALASTPLCELVAKTISPTVIGQVQLFQRYR